MIDKPDWYDEAVARCGSFADVAGDVAGGVYGEGALAVSGNAAFAGAVNAAIDHQVDGGWAAMCDLPENLGLFDAPSADGAGDVGDVDPGTDF